MRFGVRSFSLRNSTNDRETNSTEGNEGGGERKGREGGREGGREEGKERGREGGREGGETNPRIPQGVVGSLNRM